jgi:putative transposase
MARQPRLVAPGYPHHVTQRGNDGRALFQSAFDYHLYLRIVRENARRYGLRFAGYCLMPDHVHWIAIPEGADSLSRTFGRAHSEYSRLHHKARGGAGHLWQDRFSSCALDPAHCWKALAHIERNPVRSGLCSSAAEYGFSSAALHAGSGGADVPVDTADWLVRFNAGLWREVLRAGLNDSRFSECLRKATRTGRPLGDERFFAALDFRLAPPRALVQGM